MGCVHRKGERGLRWTIAQDAAHALPDTLLKDPDRFIQENQSQAAVKDSPVRSAIVFSGPSHSLFLKAYKARKPGDRLKHIFLPSKARREWEMVRRALAAGIPTAAALAMGERRTHGVLQEAFLVTEAISDSVPLIESIRQRGGEDYVLRAARLLRSMHDAGLHHRDLHAGNILVVKGEEDLYVIDLHSCRFTKRVSERRRLWGLAQFYYSVRGWLSREDRETFLRLYDEDGYMFKGRSPEILRRIARLEEQIYRRHMKSRTRRCLKNSSGFYVAKRNGWRIWSRRHWEIESLFNVLERHRAHALRETPSLLKKDRRTSITLFEEMGKRICVKEYVYAGFLSALKDRFRTPAARKGWMMGNGLVVRGIGAITPLALLERRRWGFPREAFLVMESPPEYSELDRYMVRTFSSREDRVRKKVKIFVQAVADFMATLHQLRIAHKDLKTCNIMISEKGRRWDFGLVDLDDIQLDKKISERRLIVELMQLHTSTPLFIDMNNRRAFLVEFLKRIGTYEVRNIVAKVLDASRGRQLIYVSPQGDVVTTVDWDSLCSDGPQTAP